MPDMKTLTIGGTTYTIVDETARTERSTATNMTNSGTGVVSAGDITDSSGNVLSSKVDASDFFKIVTVEVSNASSIAAHGYQGAQTITVPSASRPTGMTLVGIVGQSTSNYRLVSSTCYVNGTHSISANMANTSASSINANNTITFYLLYIKATEA